ncbi:MAG: adenylate kinase [Candidatus Rokuibacteriota bacterium]
MRLVFLGPPGAGKGTQARELAREWEIPQIATGDMLRQAVQGNTMLGRDAKGLMDRGQLVSDAVIIGLIAERLREADAKRGFILDGFPRTIAQAEGLDRLLKNLGQTLDAVVYFEVSEPELLRRLTGRRVCRKCQATYHVVSAPPRREGVCDQCGGALHQREDDSEATVRNRLAVYARQTLPLLDHYQGRGLLATVHGEGGMDEVREAIRRATKRVAQ